MIPQSKKNVNTFTTTREFSGQRLDKFLVGQFPDYSRSRIQKMIKGELVLVNNKKPAVHQFLKAGDIVSIKPTQVSAPAMVPNLRSRPRRVATLVPEIIADTPDYLVINKPAGLLVHEAPGQAEPTLVDWVLKKYPDIKKIGEDPMRPGIIHRLDKEVSGLMVIAKAQDMFDHLKSQFKTRKIKKEYLALVYGAPAKPEGEINFNIDRSQTEKRMAAVPASQQRGRPALTGFDVVKKFTNYTLLKLKLHTGRPHQIRVHLNAYGLPVVGDPLYKPKKLKEKIKLDRIFLQSSCLGFHNLNNKWQEFSIPLDNQLQTVLEELKV